jgi:parallel beta-helix repeat protein
MYIGSFYGCLYAFSTSPHPPPVPAEPQTITVPNDYPTIQEAINNAKSGDTIQVCSGTYYKNIVVNKSLSIRGQEASDTIIDSTSGEATVTITAPKVEISGFTIQRSSSSGYGVLVSNTTEANITGNKISALYGGTTYAVYLYYSPNSIIMGNELLNVHTALFSQFSPNCTIMQNRINDCTIGVNLRWSGNSSYKGNNFTIFDCPFKVWGNNVSDYANYVDDTNLANGRPIYYWVNRTSETVPTDAGAIILVNCVGITVQDLNLSDSGQCLLLAFTSDSLIQRNVISGGTDGVDVWYSANNILFNNTISTQSNAGINVISSSNNSIIQNNLSNNICGVKLFLSSSYKFVFTSQSDNYKYPRFLGNAISGNNITGGNQGIYLDTSGSNEISQNNITSCYLSGIGIGSSSDDNIIRENEITKGANSGISIRDASNQTVSNNTLLENQFGIIIEVSSNNNVHGNTIANCSQASITGSNTTHTEVTSNSITNSGGISFEYSFDINILGNVVVNGSSAGVQLSSCCNSTVVANVLNDNVCGISVGVAVSYAQDDKGNIIGGPFTEPCVNNTIYHNNIQYNRYETRIVNASGTWDNGKEGNYWINYRGIDANGDEIGDVPYVIDSFNKDRYPLMAPFNPNPSSAPSASPTATPPPTVTPTPTASPKPTSTAKPTATPIPAQTPTTAPSVAPASTATSASPYQSASPNPTPSPTVPELSPLLAAVAFIAATSVGLAAIRRKRSITAR